MEIEKTIEWLKENLKPADFENFQKIFPALERTGFDVYIHGSVVKTPGKYNDIDIMVVCPDALIIYRGSGPVREFHYALRALKDTFHVETHGERSYADAFIGALCRCEFKGKVGSTKFDISWVRASAVNERTEKIQLFTEKKADD